MKKNILLGCLVCLAASNLLLPLTLASIVEVTEDDSGEPIISVESSRPETTYKGELGFKTTNWGLRRGFVYQFKAGEEFCMYTPVLGMRNLTCYIVLTKFWDTDIEVTLSNSEGEILEKGKTMTVGKRLPNVLLHYPNIPRPDIFELCIRNTGSTKTLQQHMILSRNVDVEKYMQGFVNISNTHNISSEALIRVESRLAEIVILSKLDVASVKQDYFRLTAIANWVDSRCAISCALMLFCCFMSTVVIRRWFGSPRSSV